MDITISAIVLIFLSPFILIICLVVWVTSGKPIFFRQWRLGKFGEPFKIIKYRTMVVDAPEIRNPDGSTYNADDDPRLTSIGRFLRRTSLDELPQFINVFLGDMSLVGPRPDQVNQLQFYTEEEKIKLQVKPGITGLAQINGRNSIPWEQRKQYDIEYTLNHSLLLDIEILLKTIPYFLLRRDVFVDTNDREEIKS